MEFVDFEQQQIQKAIKQRNNNSYSDKQISNKNTSKIIDKKIDVSDTMQDLGCVILVCINYILSLQ